MTSASLAISAGWTCTGPIAATARRRRPVTEAGDARSSKPADDGEQRVRELVEAVVVDAARRQMRARGRDRVRRLRLRKNWGSWWCTVAWTALAL